MIFKENCLFFFKNDLKLESLKMYNRIPIKDFIKNLRPSECVRSSLNDDEKKKMIAHMNEPGNYSIFIDGDHKILKIMTGDKNETIELYGNKSK
jgi:hypothetical protein